MVPSVSLKQLQKLREAPRQHRQQHPAGILHDELVGYFQPGSQQSSLAQLQRGVRLELRTGPGRKNQPDWDQVQWAPASPVKWILQDSRWRTAVIETPSRGSLNRSSGVSRLGFESLSSGSPSLRVSEVKSKLGLPDGGTYNLQYVLLHSMQQIYDSHKMRQQNVQGPVNSPAGEVFRGLKLIVFSLLVPYDFLTYIIFTVR